MRTRAALTTLAVVMGMVLSGAPPALAGRPAETTRPTRPKPTAVPSPTGTPSPTAPAPMPTAKRTVVVLPTLEGRGSTAYDVDTAGVVVGSAELTSGYWHAVRWVDGRIEDLGTLGGLNSQAEAIEG
ncbi:hypothetical protein [Micromonospora sp. NPDC049282]|uniref:hypothetical protein n=1 Tax=Micromonospora sp. NPDC049282 TaxID=3364269 RepID=UPI00371481A7